MKNLIMLYLFVCLTFALPVTFSEVFSEQPAVYTFTVPSESSAQLKDYLAELEKYGASEEVKEMIKKSGIGDWWASVGNNIHFLEWLETRTIVKQIGKKQDGPNEVLVYEMDIKKAYQHKKELCAQFKMVGDDAATNILYGLVRTAIAFNDKEMVRFFIDLPGPDGAGSTNKQNILWEIKDAIPITFLQVFFEQPKEVQKDTLWHLFIETGKESAKISTDRKLGEEESALIKRYNTLVDNTLVVDGELLLPGSEEMDYRVLIAVEKKNQYPAFSPDGRQIAFEAGAGDRRHIWAVNSDGSHPRQLTHGVWGAYKPVWSPDGKKIAFFSDRSGNFDIWLMDADGSVMQQLTKDPHPDRYPTFSPDGKRIAFSSWRNGGPHLYVMDVDGSNLRQITFGEGRDYEPSWSPHGDEIAFFSKRSGKYAIWKVNADGTGLRQLTKYGDMYLSGWWPDGSQILAFDNDQSIFLVNSDGSEVTGILTLESNLWHPIVSNDGERILFETAASFSPDEKTPDEIVILEAKMPAAAKRKAYQRQFGPLIPEGYEIINALQADTNHDNIPELLLSLTESEEYRDEYDPVPSRPALLLIFERRGNRWVEVWRFQGGNSFSYWWGDIGLMDGIFDKSLRVMDMNGDGKKDLLFTITTLAISGCGASLHLYSWDEKASTYVPLTAENITFGAWGARLLADGLVIRDIEPRYSGKEIIVAKYIFDYTIDDLNGWEIFFYGFQAGRYILYKQIKTPKKYENAGVALRIVTKTRRTKLTD